MVAPQIKAGVVTRLDGHGTLITEVSVDGNEVIRRFARDRWVRLHGTPRVSVLSGSKQLRELWEQWAAVTGLRSTLLDGNKDFGQAFHNGLERASMFPAELIAVITREPVLARWEARAPDRLRALAKEGLVSLTTDRKESDAAKPLRLDARSLAEAILYDALEATPATKSRFELNGRLAVHFGPDAAEVDLLSRKDGIAVEVDGYHHFDDPDRYRRDRRKDLLLQTQGLLVIRLLADDVMRDPRGCVDVICQALAYRRG